MTDRVAILGLGRMGARYASRLVDCGVAPIVWNRSPQAAVPLVNIGAEIAKEPAEAVAKAACILVSFADGKAVRTVFESEAMTRALQSTRPLVIDTSSTAPAEAVALAQKLENLGATFVDAPVSGGTAGAEQGSLTIFAGGRTDAVRHAEREVLCHLGRVHHLGGVGAGQSAKLVNQVIAGIVIGGVAEGLALADLLDMDAAKLLTALRGGFADSRILELHGPRMVANDFAPRGRSATHLKDLRNAIEAADGASAALPLSQSVAKSLETVLDRYGDLDHSALAKLVRDNCARLTARE